MTVRACSSFCPVGWQIQGMMLQDSGARMFLEPSTNQESIRKSRMYATM